MSDSVRYIKKNLSNRKLFKTSNRQKEKIFYKGLKTKKEGYLPLFVNGN